MSSPAPRVLPSLTGLRAVAAGIVFVRHAEYLYTDTSLAPYTLRVFQQGAVGVSFFYILSGFVLTWAWRPGTGADDWRPETIAAAVAATIGLLAASALLAAALYAGIERPFERRLRGSLRPSSQMLEARAAHA